jgi:hypothetical protein
MGEGVTIFDRFFFFFFDDDKSGDGAGGPSALDFFFFACWSRRNERLNEYDWPPPYFCKYECEKREGEEW